MNFSLRTDSMFRILFLVIVSIYTTHAQNSLVPIGYTYPRLNLLLPEQDKAITNVQFRYGVASLSNTAKGVRTETFGKCARGSNSGCEQESRKNILSPGKSGKIFRTVEVRAKIPKGDWLWPGNRGPLGVGHDSSTLKWGPSTTERRFRLTRTEKTSVSRNLNVEDGFRQKGDFSGGDILAGGSNMASFNQDLNLILNSAVGRSNGYLPDKVRKPWSNNSPRTAADFWNDRSDRLPTRQGENSALIVDYVETLN